MTTGKSIGGNQIKPNPYISGNQEIPSPSLSNQNRPERSNPPSINRLEREPVTGRSDAKRAPTTTRSNQRSKWGKASETEQARQGPTVPEIRRRDRWRRTARGLAGDFTSGSDGLVLMSTAISLYPLVTGLFHLGIDRQIGQILSYKLKVQTLASCRLIEGSKPEREIARKRETGEDWSLDVRFRRILWEEEEDCQADDIKV